MEMRSIERIVSNRTKITMKTFAEGKGNSKTTRKKEMTDTKYTKELEAAQKKFFESVHDARHDFIQDMGNALNEDGKLCLPDVLKINVAANTIINTVHLTNVMQECERIGKEIDDPEMAGRLLVDIVSRGQRISMENVIPEMLGEKVASKIMFKILTGAMERDTHEPAPNTSFEEIITGMKRPL